jgi:pimeloyl-ACP methyl ester carboxylesterase
MNSQERIMFVHESGSVERPAIVFLHGNGTNGTMWRAHLAWFVDYHWLVPDFPGYGRSNDQEWVSLEETAKQIAELIHTRTATGRAHLVGLSLGERVAITLLSQAPDLLDHTIVDGAGVLPLAGLPFIRLGLRILQPFLKTNFVINTLARAMKIPAEGYMAFQQGMFAMSAPSFTHSFLQALSLRQPTGLEQVRCPTLFVAGEKEPAAVRQSNHMLAGIMPHAQSCEAPGLGHGWLAEAPALHCRMVEAWINNRPLPQELVAARSLRLQDKSAVPNEVTDG